MRLGQLAAKCRNLAFEALDCGNSGGIGTLVSVVLFKTLILDITLCEGFWVLNLLGWEDWEGLDAEVL